MIKTAVTLLLCTILLTVSSYSSAEGLPVAKYLEDPEHKNEVLIFYLSTLYTGINLANSRANPPLFCVAGAEADSAFAVIDKRIMKLQKENKLTEETTVDSIMMDILIDEYPCK